MDQETDGILQVGEVPVIVRRDSPREENHQEAHRSGRESALREMLVFINESEAAAPPFTDLRPYANLRTWVTDKMRANRG
jgi:hypothetical protein